MARSLCVAGATFFLFSCGVQGPPQPPRVERPEAVEDLRVSQVGNTLLLTFTLPQLANDGERLTKPLEARIFRAIEPAGRNAPSGSSADLWKVLQPEDIERRTQNGKVTFPISLSDQEFAEWRGATFSFSVSALTRGFRRRPVESELSNWARWKPLRVSGPVRDLRVRPQENALELSWSAPARDANASNWLEPSTYRIYRSRTGEPGSFELLAETAFQNYSDADFEFDRPLFYKVRSVFKEDDQLAESEDSRVARITPRDVYAPGAPTGLSGVHTGAGVELIWTANAEPDLAGYNVYRREGKGSFRQVNTELLMTPIFRDASTQAGRSYAFRVTAVDLAGNESAPSEEFGVEIR